MPSQLEKNRDHHCHNTFTHYTLLVQLSCPHTVPHTSPISVPLTVHSTSITQNCCLLLVLQIFPFLSTIRDWAQPKTSTINRDLRGQKQGLQAQHQPLCLSLRSPRVLCTQEVIHRQHGMVLSAAPRFQVVTPNLGQMGAEQELNIKVDPAP